MQQTREYSRLTGIGKERDIALCLSSSDWRGLNRNQKQNIVLEIGDNHEKESDNLTKPFEVERNTKPFNYVSLFSGIGGFEQALNKHAGNCVMASEIDKFANHSYEVLYGHKTVGDVTKIDAKDVPDHDLLVGGFPCQAFSVAGKRLGFEDTRGTLFFEVARIAKEKQPKALILENVKGLVNHAKGATLDTIMQTLDEIGYTTDFNIVNSKFFDVPQNRERWICVAIRNDLIESEPWANVTGSTMLPKAKRRIQELGVHTFNFDWPAQESVTKSLRDVLEAQVDEKYYLSEEKTAKLVAELEAQEHVNGVEVRACLTPFREEKRQNGPRFKANDAPAHTVNTQDRHGVAIGYATNPPKYRIRKLTPLECFRLQSFPDEAHQALVDAGLSDSQRYKQAGNAVTVNVIDAIAAKLLPYLA